MNLQILQVSVLGPVHVYRGEVKLRHSLLLVDLIFVQDLHVCENWARYCHEESGHIKHLTLAAWHQVRFSVYFLSDVIKMSEDYSALRKTQHAVKWTFWTFKYIDDILGCLFKTIDTIWNFSFLFLFSAPSIKLKPRLKVGVTIGQESLHLFNRRFLALKGRIYDLEIDDLSKH